MGIRYDARKMIANTADIYEEFRKERDVKKLTQYNTPEISGLTKEKRQTLRTVRHIWQVGDKYWKLSQQFYNDPDLWWLIAWYNQKPTEAHINKGDTVYVPLPLERILRYYNQ